MSREGTISVVVVLRFGRSEELESGTYGKVVYN